MTRRDGLLSPVPGLRLPHPKGVVIGAVVVIGRNVTVFQQVTLGSRRIKSHGAREDPYPVIEDDCVVFAGAKVLGSVRIGAGAQVGANAVVLQDVPPGPVAGGVPARIA